MKNKSLVGELERKKAREKPWCGKTVLKWIIKE
jgi:hypothetical protein